MPSGDLRREIEDGVIFWGFEQDGCLIGVMGIQDFGQTLRSFEILSSIDLNLDKK